MSEPRAHQRDEHYTEVAEAREKTEKHTSIPWQFGGQESSIGNNHFYVIGPASSPAVANVWNYGPASKSYANAEFIVRAVNNHAKLVAALEAAEFSLVAIMRRLNPPMLESENENLIDVRAALAEARKG